MPEPEQPRHGVDFECQPLCPICRGADLLRAVAPPELAEELQDLQREFLLAVRDLAAAAVQVMEQRAARAEAEAESEATGQGPKPAPGAARGHRSARSSGRPSRSR